MKTSLPAPANKHARFWILFVASLIFVTLLASSFLASQKTSAVIPNDNQLMDVAPGSLVAAGSGYSKSSISTDGRFVSFVTNAALDPIDTNTVPDVYVRDTLANTVSLVSVNYANTGAGDLDSHNLKISPDGRYILFYSRAQNLLATALPTSEVRLYLRDVQAGATELASPTHNGTAPTGSTGFGDISADGRFVVFASSATNIVTNDTNGHSDVFLYDRLFGTMRLVSQSHSGLLADGPSTLPYISCDGAKIVFMSSATNLTTVSDLNGQSDVFITHTAGETAVTSNITPNSDQISRSEGISCDGQTAILTSNATNLTSESPSTSTPTLYAFATSSGLIQRVNKSSGGNLDNRVSARNSSVNGDGRFILFVSNSSTLVPNDTNGSTDLFLRDMQKGTTHRMVLRHDGSEIAQGSPNEPHISNNGHWFTFTTNDRYLTPQTQNGNIHTFRAPTGSGFWEL